MRIGHKLPSNFSWSGRAASVIAPAHACRIIASSNVIAARRSTSR